MIFRGRARAEAKLYMQLGAWFTILFTAVDIVEVLGLGSSDGFNPGVMFRGLLQTLFAVYTFAAPIGATLMKHMLLQRSDRVIWMLAAIATVFMLGGLL